VRVAVTLDAGKSQGVLEGMEFLTELVVSIRVTDVLEDQCLAVATYLPEYQEVSVGTVACTRPPWR